MTNGLFREQSVRNRMHAHDGRVISGLPISHITWSTTALLFILLTLILCFFGEYTKRIEATGQITSDKGIVKVDSKSPGVITGVFVKVGDHIKKGDVLISISEASISSSLGSNELIQGRSLADQKRAISSQIDSNIRLSHEQEIDLNQQIFSLNSQILILNDHISIQRKEISNYRSLLEKMRPVAAQGYISAYQMQTQEALTFEAEGSLKDLEKQLAETRSSMRQEEKQLEEIPSNLSAKNSDLSRQLAQIESLISQNAVTESQNIIAPSDGTISEVIAVTGTTIGNNANLVSIIPKDGALIAELQLDAKSAGFIQLGNVVDLNYDAFPYERFGSFRGRVLTVSKSALTPQEINAWTGANDNQQAKFVIQVSLPSDYVTYQNHNFPLKPGMSLSAHIMLERRPIYKWVMSPLDGIKHNLDL